MPKPTTSQPARDSGEWYPIRTVSDLTGVNAVTLRAWERRYGLIRPARAESGHRLYGRDQIDLIHRILGLLKKGLSIGQVGKALAAVEPNRRVIESDPWHGYRLRVLGAVARFDEDELERIYSGALGLYPVEMVTDRLMLPVLEELGSRWGSEEGTVAEEHFFSAYMRDKLGARFHHRARLHAGPRVLAACLPQEQHEIGLLIFCLAAHDRGLRVTFLGACTPMEEIASAARRAYCDGVVLSGTLAPSTAVLTALPGVVAACSVPVFVGGRVSQVSRDAVVAAGAEVLGTDIHAGVERIRSALSAVQAK